jgi:hypothetical protein
LYPHRASANIDPQARAAGTLVLMHKLMRDHEILEAKFLISQTFGQRNDARR